MYEALPFIHSVYAQSMQAFETCADHSSGAGITPQNTQCVKITGLDSFSITNTMHYIVSFFIGVIQSPIKFRFSNQDMF